MWWRIGAIGGGRQSAATPISITTAPFAYRMDPPRIVSISRPTTKESAGCVSARNLALFPQNNLLDTIIAHVYNPICPTIKWFEKNLGHDSQVRRP